MGSAYTPGLTVSNDIIVRRVRRLPIKGDVLVSVGAEVRPETPVARALLPGPLQTIKLSEKLGVEPKDAKAMFRLKEGDKVEKGQVVAESKGLFGMFKSTVMADTEGVIESISEVTGNVLVREPSIPIEITAYMSGRIADIMPEEGAIVETRGAMIQGIFGIGGERVGTVRVVVHDPEQVLHADDIHETDKGKILVGGSGIAYDAIEKAARLGVVGLIAGGVRDSDLVKYLGYDIGVAITGTEAIPLTLLVTEGFGYLNMARRTFELLKSLEGQEASLNGATQIRAGVIRPELIVPNINATGDAPVAQTGGELKAGTPIRIIREPYFGLLGTVTDLPAHLVRLESGTEVRVLRAKLEDGADVTVPRANVEIIATGR